MAKISNFLSFALIMIILGLNVFISYKSYKIISEDRLEKSWIVINKKVTEKAKNCVLDNKCTNKTVTLKYLIDNEYLTKIIDPKTKEIINYDSYVDLETNSFIVLR